MPRLLRYLLVIGGGVVSILLFLLASASENSVFFDQHYSWLLGLNALMTVALLGLVSLLLRRLYKRYKRREFGSKLMARLVLLFALIGILPGTVIYIVSVQFVSRSIESWFDVRVESALESGLTLGRTVLDASLADLTAKARNVALEMSELPESAQVTQLSRLRDQEQMQEATIVNANGQIIATVGGRLGALVPDLPTNAMLRQARLTRGFSAIEGGVEAHDEQATESTGAPSAPGSNLQESPGGLRLRVVVAIPAASNAMSLQNEARFLQLLQPVPQHLAADAEALRAAYSEYQERSLARSGLRKIYIVTLTLTLLLAIFGAIAAAFLIAGDLAKPLLVLAEGTKAVAEGNLSPRPIVPTKDELGTLTQSFNTMTRQLSEARAAAERNRFELENAKAYLESVLANMSAGVMVLDSHFRLVTCNESVERILQHNFDQHIGKPLARIDGLQPLSDAVTKAFSEQSAQSAVDESGVPGSGELHWQKQIEIPRLPLAGEADGEQSVTLLARGSHLPVAGSTGYVVVFDDISDVISAQRSIAWGEVARRLAHEIKNPLTPIQLSAERLQMKLEDKLAPQDATMLTKSTSTIVNQVSAMKRMVDDFRDYAKTPPAVLTPLDLNALVEEILHLYIGGDELHIIHPVLAPALPQVMGDATQLRQVIHNLLQNAQDAVEERPDPAHPPRIDVVTEAIHYQDSDGSKRTAVRLTITDNGPGFSSKILSRAFEPYVTSKQRGTGLGLAMVKKIIDEHGGRIDIKNRSSTSGAKVAILLLKLAQ
ncbi:sensor histidine kinase [Noviherbaspirillum autotrophicum]|uniref:histidine kinase n=1 Tax=Noviherbaspirillum autotrophicum TaxID=709839 RepID=A0A0C2BYF6_9BURK|nr:ATP-binding protein [Noviherbaspirillum autotrophicum]KIF83071.1 histidine kinase [Noviherbaspirillum autotrophicum]